MNALSLLLWDFTMQEHSLVDYNEYVGILVDINFKNVYQIQK